MPREARSIEGSVHDVTGCVIYASTHWYGAAHPFNEALQKKTTTVVDLVWYDNPDKRAGLYKSPDYDVIEIVDIDYYRKLCPEVFNGVEANTPIKYSEFERSCLLLPTAIQRKVAGINFVADACDGIPGDVRSPWHDAEEEKRKGHKRDFISNVWATPVGSNDSLFDATVLNRVKSQFKSRPAHQGELMFDVKPDGRVNRYWFANQSGKLRLKWWGELVNGRPPSDHNYVIGCDIALGTGTSNSVAMILDTNTREIAGSWVCSVTNPETFADTVFALHCWCNQAFVVFENNGGHGVNFGRRLKWQGCTRIYTQRTEDAKVKKTKNRYGWSSTPNAKADLLGELGIAISESLRRSSYTKVIVHDEETIQELYGYMFYENGDIGPSETADLTSGARKRHGDRVIALGLCVLGAKYQSKGYTEKKKHDVIPGTFADRKRRMDREEQDAKQYARRYWF